MQIIPNRKIWFTFSGVLIVLALAALGFWGLKPGIDFTGGSLLEVKFAKDYPPSEEIRALLSGPELGLSALLIQPSAENTVVLRFPPLTEDQHQAAFTALSGKYAGAEEVRFDSIGPAIGRELFRKSLGAIVIVTVVVLLYIAWSFRKINRPVPAWVYGAVVVVTFLHDVIIPLGVFAWLGKFYGLEVGSPFIAAVLLILGYSINDTIVVLDRVRENLKRLKAPFESIVEASVHQTINRSLNTSLTTLFVLVALYIFGGSTLSVFSLALIIGIALGTYSSIFIAAPLLVVWYRLKSRR